MSNVQCPMSNVQCPMSNVQCPMSNVRSPESALHNKPSGIAASSPPPRSSPLKTLSPSPRSSPPQGRGRMRIGSIRKGGRIRNMPHFMLAMTGAVIANRSQVKRSRVRPCSKIDTQCCNKTTFSPCLNSTSLKAACRCSATCCKC
ncbi:MAG TPA: hypothetical protein ENH32_02425 [Proteobacteria bacterium]|nr:hypothetical protein [Pseudomonadota bacterium]